MTVVSDTVSAQPTSAYMTNSSCVKFLHIGFIKYHLLGKFKLIIYLFDIIFKTIYEFPSHIVMFAFSCERHWLMRIDAIVEAFYVLAKRAGYMSLIFISARLVRIWLTRINRFDN